MSINNIKHLLKVLALVCLICFISDKIIFCIVNRISDNVYTGQAIGKLNLFLKIKENKKLLIFGSSRANHNINPTALEANSFNMGVDGRNIAYATALIKTIETRETQTLLIQIDPESVFSGNYNGEDIKLLACKYHRNAVIKTEMDKLDMVNPFQHYFWSIAYNNKIIGIVKNHWHPSYNYRLYNGYDPYDVDESQEKIFSKILSQNKIAECQDSVTVNKLCYNYLLDLKDFAKANNKKLIFFTSPVYNDHCKKDNYELVKLANEINIIYLDFTDLFQKNNSRSLWKDEIHLSRIGAERFTSILKEKLNSNVQQSSGKSTAVISN